MNRGEHYDIAIRAIAVLAAGLPKVRPGSGL